MIKVNFNPFKTRIIDKLKQSITRSIKEGGNEISANVAESARDNLSSRQSGAASGALVSSIYAKPVTKQSPFRFMVTSDLPYAKYVEHGTGPAVGNPGYWIPKTTRLVQWANAAGIPFWKLKLIIHARGTKAIEFLGDAVEDVRHNAPGIMIKSFVKNMIKI